MTTIPTLFVYFLYDHIPTFFYIFKKCFLLLVYIRVCGYTQRLTHSLLGPPRPLPQGLPLPLHPRPRPPNPRDLSMVVINWKTHEHTLFGNIHSYLRHIFQSASVCLLSTTVLHQQRRSFELLQQTTRLCRLYQSVVTILLSGFA